MKMERHGPGRRGFLKAAAGITVSLPLLSGATGAPADAATADPDQLFSDGWFAAADRGYARLLASAPQDAHAWAQRGRIALLSNRLGPAGRFLAAALKLAPGDQVAALNLAACCVRRRDYARAAALFTRAGDRIDAAFCSAVQGTPYAVSGDAAARVPFRTLDPLPTVDGSVNGSPLRFVLDTGAAFGLSAAAAAAAGVQPMATVMTQEPGGPVESYIGVASSLVLGGIEIRNIPVMWNASSLLDAPAGAAGVIGTTVFSRFLTTMDYPGQALELRRDKPSPLRAPGGTAAPMWLAPDHFIFSRGRIGGSGTGLVLLDTGGAGLGIVLTSDQAAQDGVTPDYGDPGTYLGVTGYPAVASQVSLGPVTRRDITGAVGPFLPPADFGFSDLGTLSHEFFRPLSVTFDFTRMVIGLRGPDPG